MIKFLKILVIFISFILVSCSMPENDLRMEVVMEAVKKKEESYRNRQYKKCIERAELEANAYIDSIIANEIYLSLLDSLSFPSKPIKPDYPDSLKLKDTSLVRIKTLDVNAHKQDSLK
ncbi:MAG TPA: hypothetical protein P5235_01310 [Saprospiraceae bacterium]|nr:hypothetical protein [Saprospiraceae bacterium]MCB9328892.1 hypothetical protein [Lewinellaceae bacterium]HRX27995.1 hypothetical protein [Saprospiraceae bacterium]